MRKPPRWIPLLALSLCPACAYAADPEPLAPVVPGSPMVINALMGSINGTPVFVDDVLRPIDGDLRALKANPKMNLTVFRHDARDLISRQVQSLEDDILMASAAADGLDDSDRQRVDFIMNRLKLELISKHGGVEALAEQELRLRGSSLQKELNDKRHAITRELFLRKTLLPKIQVTRQQLLADYNLHLKDKYTVETEIEMFTITLPIANFLDQEKDPIRENKTRAIQNPTPDQVREATNLAKARAAELIKQLNDGADFATLAAQNPGDSHATNGGRWPKLKRGTLASKEWENLVFSTPPNTIGPLLVTDPDKPLLAGVRITKVGDVTPGHVIPFSEAQAGIESDMKNEQFNDLSRDYITKMRNKSAVEGVERMVDAAIDAAISRYLTP